MWIPGKSVFQWNLTSWKMWLPGKCDFLEMWIPGKSDFLGFDNPGNVTLCKIWPFGKCHFPVNLTFWEMRPQEMWNPGVCDFLGNVTSWEILLPGKSILMVKVAFQTKWITGNSYFRGKSYKYGIVLIFGRERPEGFFSFRPVPKGHRKKIVNFGRNRHAGRNNSTGRNTLFRPKDILSAERLIQ